MAMVLDGSLQPVDVDRGHYSYVPSVLPFDRVSLQHNEEHLFSARFSLESAH